MYKNLLLLIFALTVSGCNTSSPAAKEDGAAVVAAQKLEGVKWKLSSFGLTRMAVPKDAFLTFNDGHYSGKGGCNQIFGSYTTSGSKIRFKEGMSTMMACPQMGLERAFLQRLVSVESYTIDAEGSRLDLRAGEESLLLFTKQ